MLKWLRNIVLLAIVIAGALKLAAWYAVSHDAQRVTAGLAPYAEIKYAGLAAGLNGSVTISDVSVAPKGAHRIYRADSATFDSPGLVWLLRHALLHENDLPAHFGITVTGLNLPPQPWLDPQWLDPATFALFASAGCQAHLGADDYRRMDIDVPAPSRERFEYRYDAGQHALVATLNLSAAGFATLALEADLSRFDPARLMTPGFWDATHIDQLSATYTDNGFVQRRNAYCAKRENLTAAQFTERHVGAVQALLHKARIQPADEVMQMYKALVGQGGNLRLLSLPNAVFSVNAWDTTSREDLLRQLNLTARYQDKPPIMFRLAFLPAPEPAAPAAEPTTAAALAPAAPPANPVPAERAPNPAPAPVPPAPAPTPTAAAPKAAAPEPKSVSAPAAAAVTASAATSVATTAASVKSPPATSNAESANYLDRAEAGFTPSKVAPPATEPPEKPAAPIKPLASSAPAPSNSTQALIWKPGVIEQLPAAAPLQKDYTVVDFSSLPQLSGRHVRLITLGGKRIEGFVAAADNRGLQLRIDRGGGNALIAINRDSISQVQLLHW